MLQHTERVGGGADVERLLTVPDVAAVLRVSRSQAYRLCRVDIASVRVGRSGVRVRPADLAAYLDRESP